MRFLKEIKTETIPYLKQQVYEELGKMMCDDILALTTEGDYDESDNEQ